MAEWAAKRFWTDVSCVPEGAGFAVYLDTRPVRTPAKAPLILPTLALAQAVAAEWLAQDSKIDPLTMPHTRSANAALDKVAPQRAAVESMIADYCGTDLLCYRAPAPAGLIAAQSAAWDPLLGWARAEYGAALNVTTGVMPVAQPAPALSALTGVMAAMGDFDIVAFHDLVSLSGSFVLGLAVARGHIAPETGWTLSRTDEDWQARQWGLDDEAAEKAAQKQAAFLHAHLFLTLANQEAKHNSAP